MKRIISLIISASIFLQMVVPGVSLVTYAAEGQGPYKFQWESNKGLDAKLETKDAVNGSTEALVSWEVSSNTAEPYILDYFIETNNVAENVRFTFKQETGTKATAKIEVFEVDGATRKKKDFRIFDFTSIASGESWIPINGQREANIDILGEAVYKGGRVKIGDLEIRFRWKDGKVHVQTNQVKHGYITPFSLKYGTGPQVTINVLTGIEGYKVSPIHIEAPVVGQINNKGVIEVPGSGEKPGSKPGIKVDFKRPKKWNGTIFKELSDLDAKEMVATLELADLTDVATARLVFDLGVDDTGQGSEVTGLDIGKKVVYNAGNYSLYLAEDDVGGNVNIIKWDKLEKSMILKTTQLSLIQKASGPIVAQSLGSFTPQQDSGGRHTYLGYTIERSSMEEAFIRIQPYNGAKNTEYTYIIESAPNLVDGAGAWKELIEHKYITTGENTEKSFTIPVPFSSNFGAQFYKVTAKHGSVTMSSQILFYTPDQDLTVPPPTPVIQSIDNIYAVPPKNVGAAPETIGFDLTWSAPKNSSQNKLLDTLLEKGDIYYEVFFHEDLQSTEGRGTLTKVFRVWADADKKISVEPYGGVSAGNTPQVEVRYNESKNTFIMENIVLKNIGKDNWEQVEIDPLVKDNYDQGSDYPTFVVNDNMPKKEVPGIYYVTMRALYDGKTPGVQMGVSNTSNPKSITISPLEEVIPVPTKIESKNFPDENDSSIIRQTFSWVNINLDRYIKQMLNPLNLAIEGGGMGVYEIYLYQKKNIAEADLLNIEATATDLHDTKKYELKAGDIATLRDNGVIRLDYDGSSNVGMNNIVLEGLDTNQVYYTTIRVRLDIKDTKDPAFKEKRYSVFSKEHSFTTYVEPSEPGPGERVPPVPEKLQIIDQPNNTTTIIGWEAPEYAPQEDERLYYEMLRVDSRVLVKEENSRLFSIQKLLGDDKKDEMAGWRTREPLVQKYVKATNAWSNAIPDQPSIKLQLEDPDLNPNKLYYYYVRTVLVVEGEEMYSSWIGLPVTTDPIQKPIQLKIEDKKDYSHDPKKEIVVSFLAPIPKGANIPADYDFDTAVQGEMDDEYKLNYSTTRLTSKQDDKDIPTGYSHYVYKINNLKPGKRYDIKVRIIDKLVDMVGGQYPKSLYSDRVTTRTEFDQDEQDKDDKFEEYLKYFEDKVEVLRRRPYWTLEDGENSFSVKYRSQYINPEINSTKAYKLDVREGVSNFTYRMPASVIESANLNQTSFEIKQGDVTYSIRPSTITSELEEVRAAIQDINGKYISDYYVTFNFSQRKSTTRTGLLTPEISVDIQLVRLREEDRLLDDDIMIALNNRINSEKVRFIDDLERTLKLGKILDEELEVLINRSLESVKASHQRDTSSIINRSTYKIISISSWNKSMLIMAGIEGNAVAEGYLLGLADTAFTTFNVGGGYGIEVNHPGTYAFKGQKINMPVIPGVGGAGDLIGKYQLTDFFGVDGNINPSRTVSKRNVLGAMARVLGAPRGADYIQHLKQMNIKGVTNLGMDLPIKKGEGIYLLMQVYEKTHNKPINSVNIKNRNAVSNIRSFNQLHQPYVLVAVDSKIVSAGTIGPNDVMQIKDVLQILSNIMATIR